MRRSVKLILIIAGYFVVLFIGIAIGGAGNTKTIHAVTAAPAPAVTITAKAQAPAPAANTVMTGDGVYVVGTDIRHGVYHTTGAAGGSGGDCYYALLSSTDTNSIIDNNNVTGPATITVGPGVKAVDTSGCNAWNRTGA
jgi:hypothetical protein